MSVCETWPIGWPSPVNIETTRPLNGNCEGLGFPQARQLLDHERVRERLGGLCAEAQKGFSERLKVSRPGLFDSGASVGGLAIGFISWPA
jgi:hypothetical protein